MGRKKTDATPRVSAKLSSQAARLLRVLAAVRNQSVSEVAEGLAREALRKDVPELLDKLEKEEGNGRAS